MKSLHQKRKKVVAMLDAGLGNQMFRHAASIELARRTNRVCVHDRMSFTILRQRSYLLHHFQGGLRTKHWNYLLSAAHLVVLLLAQRLSLKFYDGFLYLFNIRCMKELPMGEYDLAFSCLKDGFKEPVVYVKNFCQNIKYLPEEKTLREEFRFVTEPLARNRELLALLMKENAVSVHVRRSDYLQIVPESVIGIDYYKRAVDELKRQDSTVTRWIVFSDDVFWCKEHLDFIENPVYVEGNADTPWEDLRLMTACRHHIIANSSFSWWGAYLGRDPEGITIAPKYWLSKKLTEDCLLKAGWHVV